MSAKGALVVMPFKPKAKQVVKANNNMVKAVSKQTK